MAKQLTAGTPQKILVVDDNLVILKVLTTKLKSDGYDVLTAVDGSEAVGMTRREKPDLMLLDLNFPPDAALGSAVSWDGYVIMD